MYYVLYTFAAIACSLVRRDDGTWRLPVGDQGNFCEWPLDPWSLYGQPHGMYHCPSCGSMVMAGMPHTDYAVLDLP